MARKKVEEVKVDDDPSDDVVECVVADEYSKHKFLITKCAVIPIVKGKVSVMPKTKDILEKSGFLK